MDEKMRQEIALHRWAVIAEAANMRLTRSERGSGGGGAGRRPSPSRDTGKVRARPELFGEAAALRLELPGRSAAQIASILFHRHGITVSGRTGRGERRPRGRDGRA